MTEFSDKPAEKSRKELEAFLEGLGLNLFDCWNTFCWIYTKFVHFTNSASGISQDIFEALYNTDNQRPKLVLIQKTPIISLAIERRMYNSQFFKKVWWHQPLFLFISFSHKLHLFIQTFIHSFADSLLLFPHCSLLPRGLTWGTVILSWDLNSDLPYSKLRHCWLSYASPLIFAGT